MGHGLAAIPLAKSKFGVHFMYPIAPLLIGEQQLIQLANFGQQVVGLLAELAARNRKGEITGFAVIERPKGRPHRRWEDAATPGAQEGPGLLIAGPGTIGSKAHGHVDGHQIRSHEACGLQLQAPAQLLKLPIGIEPGAHHQPTCPAAIHPEQPSTPIIQPPRPARGGGCITAEFKVHRSRDLGPPPALRGVGQGRPDAPIPGP